MMTTIAVMIITLMMTVKMLMMITWMIKKMMTAVIVDMSMTAMFYYNYICVKP